MGRGVQSTVTCDLSYSSQPLLAPKVRSDPVATDGGGRLCAQQLAVEKYKVGRAPTRGKRRGLRQLQGGSARVTEETRWEPRGSRAHLTFAAAARAPPPPCPSPYG